MGRDRKEIAMIVALAVCTAVQLGLMMHTIRAALRTPFSG